MKNTRNKSIILLTYKNKILLNVKNYNIEDAAQNVWSMIESNKMADESFSEAIIRKMKEVMNICPYDINFLYKEKFNYSTVYFSHGKLSDENVNSIERKEKQELNFFSLNEVFVLRLAPFTVNFITSYRNELTELLNGKIYQSI